MTELRIQNVQICKFKSLHIHSTPPLHLCSVKNIKKWWGHRQPPVSPVGRSATGGLDSQVSL